MKQARQDGKRASSVSRLGGAFAALVLIALLLASPAFAGFEQVGRFAEDESEEARFPESAAVDSTGAGGVPAGTLYASSLVFRYGARGEFLGSGGPFGGDGVAVDQATGYVYTLNHGSPSQPHELIKVVSPAGPKLITAFGDFGEGESFEQSPEKIHIEFPDPAGIAVDAAGTVYVSDHAINKGEFRVMVFKPQSPGDYEHYVYAGRANDISTFGRLAVDDAGNLYSGTEDGEVLEFAPGQPSTPICRYEPPGLSVGAMTVNPVTGEVFFFNGKTPKVVHQLSPCSEGEFKEAGTIEMTPTPGAGAGIAALGFNPAFDWELSRPPGVLYALTGQLHSHGYIFAPAEVRFPVVESQWVSTLTATTATLNAEIDPKGSTTNYVFQYLTNAAYEANLPAERFAGASEAPVGSATLPASQEGEHAAASLLGLQSDTEYRYRVIATSHCEPEHPEALCKETGQDQAFRTYPAEAPGLPDGRAWELVSPALKSGGEVFPLEPGGTGSAPACKSSGGCNPGLTKSAFPRQSSPDGEAVAYEGFPFSSTEGAAILNQYISRRTASGWRTTTLAPSLLISGLYAGFDTGLTEGVLVQGLPSLVPQAPFANLYTQPTASPASLSALITAQPPNRAELAVRYAGASADLSHIFFEANDALTPATPVAPAALDGGPSEYNLYEWTAGQLRLVNVAPGNLEMTPGAVFARQDGSGRAGGDVASAISADGSHVFWSGPTGQVYVRIDATETGEVKDPGKFLAASADGSRVLLDDGCLYDLAAEHCEDLTEDQANVHQGGFQGVAGYSDDLSHVYFADTAVLTGEAENSEGAKAQAGKDNLYARDANTSTTTFIATLLPGDNGSAGTADWVAQPQRRTAEASPGGRWLAFLSKAPLTGYDNVGPTCDITSEQEYVTAPCREAFLYDSVTGELRCASCNPGGSRPLGPTRLPIINPEVVSHQPRYLTDSGRLYFDTQDSLSPLDTNRAVEEPNAKGEPSGSGGAGAEDVYEYEPGGVGSCTRPGGCVSLISGGNESLDASFLATDATGKNVFFTSRERLVSRDTDDLMDLYDAREGGGFSAESESGRGECQGEACQGPAQAPNDTTPSSAAFEGPGNLVASIKPPPSSPPVRAKTLTRAQLLARALRVCRSEPKRKRARCQARARKRYAPAKKAARQTSHKRRASR